MFPAAQTSRFHTCVHNTCSENLGGTQNPLPRDLPAHQDVLAMPCRMMAYPHAVLAHFEGMDTAAVCMKLASSRCLA